MIAHRNCLCYNLMQRETGKVKFSITKYVAAGHKFFTGSRDVCCGGVLRCCCTSPYSRQFQFSPVQCCDVVKCFISHKNPTEQR